MYNFEMRDERVVHVLPKQRLVVKGVKGDAVWAAGDRTSVQLCRMGGKGKRLSGEGRM